MLDTDSQLPRNAWSLKWQMRFSGTKWSLDKGKSLFSSSWKPDTETRLYEPSGSNGYKLTANGVHNGQAYSWGYTAQNDDGKDYPIHGRQDVDAIEAYRLNDTVTIGFFKKNGQLVAFYKRGASVSGTELTVNVSGRNQDGTAYFDTLEYKA